MLNQERDENRVDDIRKWYILFSVGMGVFLATIDASIVYIALPTLVRTLNTNFAVVQWVTLAYMLIVATLILSMGRLGDLIGKKGIYLSGMIIFTLGSMMCGLSQTVYWLIFFRVVQGVGAAMMASLSVALVTEAFPSRERGKALGIIGGIVSIGIITGPVLGGILIDAISWHWIFFVNIPVGILGSFMVLRFVPNTTGRRGQRFDFAGAAILFISVLSFLLALTLGQDLGFRNQFIMLLFTIWFLTLILFIYLELQVKHPMINLHIFRNNLFSIGLFTGFISFIATAGVVLLMPFYLENILKFNPQKVGILLATVPISAGLASPFAGILSDRYGSRSISTLGLTILVYGFYSLTALNEATTVLGYVLRFVPVGLGLGIFQSPNNSAIMGAAPKEYLGIASGLLSISRTLGQTSGIALIGAMWATRVSFYAGNDFTGEPTRSAITAQVQGLQDALAAIVILVGFGLLLNVWGMILEWIRKRAFLDADHQE